MTFPACYWIQELQRQLADQAEEAERHKSHMEKRLAEERLATKQRLEAEEREKDEIKRMVEEERADERNQVLRLFEKMESEIELRKKEIDEAKLTMQQEREEMNEVIGEKTTQVRKIRMYVEMQILRTHSLACVFIAAGLVRPRDVGRRSGRRRT